MKTLKSVSVAALFAIGAFSASALELAGTKFVIVCVFPRS